MSEENKKELEDIKVSEEKDGTVTVEVPEGLMAAEAEEEKEPVKAEATEDDDADQPDDTDAVREARRARRKAKKEYIKQVQVEKDQRLIAQDRLIQDLQNRLATVEKNAKEDQMAKIKKAIEDEEARLRFAKIRLKEATEQADGAAAVSAQEILLSANDRLSKLENFRKQAEQQSQVYEAAADPAVQRFADRWMKKNPWYDPEGNDPQSRLAKRIDAELAKEGWNPASQSYWNELDARREAELQEEENNAYTEPTYETPRKRGPKSVVTGSEREVGGGASRSTFTLSAEQVRAMKDAGFWDDRSKRDKMIARYAREARQNRS